MIKFISSLVAFGTFVFGIGILCLFKPLIEEYHRYGNDPFLLFIGSMLVFIVCLVFATGIVLINFGWSRKD